jgi:hypothetical protein
MARREQRRGSAERTRTDRAYMNTLVFSGVAAAVSLGLLLLLILVPAAAVAAPLIVTVELGLLLVAGVALARVSGNDRRLRKRARDAVRTQLSATTCPDYWTLEQSDLGHAPTCRRSYATPDGTTYRVQGRRDEVDLAAFRGKPAAEVCRRVEEVGTPWTDARAACRGYAELS